jgi:WD40 repeat protein
LDKARARRLSWPLALLAAAALACSVLSPRAATPTPTRAPSATSAATETAPAETAAPSATTPPTATATPAVTGAATDTAAPSDTAAASDTAAPSDTAAASDTALPGATGTPAAAETAPVTSTTGAGGAPYFLAYVKDGQLLVSDVSGGAVGGTTQYTQAGVNDGVYDLVWSPDGQSIAFVGTPSGGDAHLYVVYAVGAGTPVDLGLGSQPSWSPDSQRIVYVREGNIWLTTVDTPQPKALTAKTNWGWGRPVFTPAGDALVVSGQPSDNMGAQGNTSFDLERLPLDGSGTLTPLPGFTQKVNGRLPYDLRFSPDGTRLAFSTSWHLSACAAAGLYYVVNADGSGLTQLSSPQLSALLQPNSDFYYTVLGYAWQPNSKGLLIASMVLDCTNFAGTRLGNTLSEIDLTGHETVISSGLYCSPSYDRTGQLIAVAQPSDNGGPGSVAIYDTSGHPVIDVGAGSLPAFQP